MKKFILVPDSFKGTLSSKKVCDVMRERILAHYLLAEVISIPVADGGEGSVDCFLSAVGGELSIILYSPLVFKPLFWTMGRKRNFRCFDTGSGLPKEKRTF